MHDVHDRGKEYIILLSGRTFLCQLAATPAASPYRAPTNY